MGTAELSTPRPKARVGRLPAAAAVLIVLGGAAIALASREDEFVYFIPTTVPEGYLLSDAQLTRFPPLAASAGYTPGGKPTETLFGDEISVSIARGDQAGVHEWGLLTGGPLATWLCCETVTLACGVDALRITNDSTETNALMWMRHDRTRMYVGAHGVSDDELLSAGEALEARNGITTTIPASSLPSGWSLAYQSDNVAANSERRSTRLGLSPVASSPASAAVGENRFVLIEADTPAGSISEGSWADRTDEGVTVRGRPARLFTPADDAPFRSLWLRWLERPDVRFVVWASPDVDVFAVAEGLREVGAPEWQEFARTAKRAADDSGYTGLPFDVVTFPQESGGQWLMRARALGEYACGSNYMDYEEVIVRIPDAQAALFPDRAEIAEGTRTILCNEHARRHAREMWRLDAANALRNATERIRNTLRSPGPTVPARQRR